MVPWHERVDFSHGPAVRNALERFGKPGLRIDAVHFSRLQQGRDGRPSPAASVAAREERVQASFAQHPASVIAALLLSVDRARRL